MARWPKDVWIFTRTEQQRLDLKASKVCVYFGGPGQDGCWIGLRFQASPENLI